MQQLTPTKLAGTAIAVLLHLCVDYYVQISSNPNLNDADFREANWGELPFDLLDFVYVAKKVGSFRFPLVRKPPRQIGSPFFFW